MMLQVNLRAFRHHMISSHHRYPVPTAVKRRQHCTMDNSQLDLRSYPTIRAPNVSCSVAGHAMNTSNEMLLYTVEEPVESVLNVLTMSDQILSDKSFGADSADFFVFIEDILKHAVRIVDNVVLDTREQLNWNLKEKMSETNFSPLLCTIKQLFSKRIYEGTREDDHYKNVWIPAVEQCFSPISRSINPEAELEHRNAFRMIRQWTAYIGFGWNTRKMHTNRPQQRTYSISGTGPFVDKSPKVFTFFYRKPKSTSVQKKLIAKVTALNQDSLMKTTNTQLKLHKIGKNKRLDTECLGKLMPSLKVNEVLSRFSDRSGFIMVSSEYGILVDCTSEEMVLKALDQLSIEWKKRTRANFEVDFMNALQNTGRP